MNKLKLLIGFVVISSWATAQDTKEWALQECIDYALENNLDVKRSRLNLESSDITLEQSKLDMLPSVNANGSYGYSWGRSIDPTTNLFVENQRIASSNASLNANVTLFNAFRMQNTIKQNKLSFEANQESLEASKNTVIFNVISLYTNVLFTKELFENAKKQLNSTQEQVNRTERMVEAGSLPKSNLLDLLAQKATNEVNVVSTENNYQLAKIQLKQALQLPPDSQVEIVVPELEVEVEPSIDQSAYEIYQIALNEMPQVKSAELNQESAEVGVKVAKSGLYPTLSLSGGLNTRYSDAADVERFVRDGGDPTIIQNPQIGFVQGTNTPVLSTQSQEIPSGEIVDGYPFRDQIDDNLSKFISLNLSIPIFNGFSARANIQRAVITEDQAKINSQDAKYQLWQTIEQAYYDVLAASKSYNASLRQVEAREESFRVTQKRYDLGAVNFTDYQIAENDLFQAQSDLLRAKYDYIFKLKILDFYQGKPLDF